MTLTAEPFTVRAHAGRRAKQAAREAKMRQLIVGFEYDPGEDWKWNSSCVGEDPMLFQLMDAEALDMPSSAVSDENARLHQKARRFCEACPVVAQCLAYALMHEGQGTWAGELFTMDDIYAARRVRKQMYEESL